MSRILLLLMFVEAGWAFNVLVYNPKFAHSHVNFMGALADRLVDAGHNVTTLMPEIDADLRDGTVRSKIIRLPAVPEATRLLENCLQSMGAEHFDRDADEFKTFIVNGYYMAKAFTAQCQSTLEHPGLVSDLTTQAFDVLITENIDHCGLGLSHVIKARSVISVSTSALWEYDGYLLGVPPSLSYNPSYLTSHLDSESILSRAKNIYNWIKFNTFFIFSNRYTQQLFEIKYGDNFPQLTDLVAKAAFHFTNSEPFMEIGRPTLRKIVDLGGLSVRDPKPLSKEWHRVLSLRNRTVLLSFGSIAESINMNDEYKLSILEALSRFADVTFIWKYEKADDEFATKHASRVPNVYLSQWTPQSDLLNDPRIVGFISHAGMGSCQEAATRGVPGFYIPLFADQPRNALVMERNHIGVVFDKMEIPNTEKLTSELGKFLRNDRLFENSKRMAQKLASRPFSPTELLSKHVEFAALFGSSESLIPEGRKLSFIQLHNLDIIVLALFFVAYVFISILYFVVLFMRFLNRRVTLVKSKDE